jgi:hypothetical protein
MPVIMILPVDRVVIHADVIFRGLVIHGGRITSVSFTFQNGIRQSNVIGSLEFLTLYNPTPQFLISLFYLQFKLLYSMIEAVDILSRYLISSCRGPLQNLRRYI